MVLENNVVDYFTGTTRVDNTERRATASQSPLQTASSPTEIQSIVRSKQKEFSVTRTVATTCQLCGNLTSAPAFSTEPYKIDWNHLEANEGNLPYPYWLPAVGTKGVPISGVTIGKGVDFGNGGISRGDFERIFPDWQQDRALSFLHGSFGKTSYDAESYLRENCNAKQRGPGYRVTCAEFTLEGQQVEKINDAARIQKLKNLLSLWQQYFPSPQFKKFEDLPPQAQTVIFDLFYNGQFFFTSDFAMAVASEQWGTAVKLIEVRAVDPQFGTWRDRLTSDRDLLKEI